MIFRPQPETRDKENHHDISDCGVGCDYYQRGGLADLQAEAEPDGGNGKKISEYAGIH